MRPGLRPFIRVAAEPIARMGGGAAALCRRPWASSLRSTGENYLHRNALPLRPKRSLVIGVENEAAARIDRIGAEDALVVLACKRARLAAFSFNETNNRSAYACRANRTERSRGSCRTGRSRIALLALLGHRLFSASRESQQQENDEPANLHD
jgi:hypothetical protein